MSSNGHRYVLYILCKSYGVEVYLNAVVACDNKGTGHTTTMTLTLTKA